MSRDLTAIAAIVLGAVLGLVIGVGVFASANAWYGTAASPLVLLLAPGLSIGAFNFTDPYSWVLGFGLVQVLWYSGIALAIRAVIRARKAKNAG